MRSSHLGAHRIIFWHYFLALLSAMNSFKAPLLKERDLGRGLIWSAQQPNAETLSPRAGELDFQIAIQQHQFLVLRTITILLRLSFNSIDSKSQ